MTREEKIKIAQHIIINYPTYTKKEYKRFLDAIEEDLKILNIFAEQVLDFCSGEVQKNGYYNLSDEDVAKITKWLENCKKNEVRKRIWR